MPNEYEIEFHHLNCIKAYGWIVFWPFQHTANQWYTWTIFKCRHIFTNPKFQCFISIYINCLFHSLGRFCCNVWYDLTPFLSVFYCITINKNWCTNTRLTFYNGIKISAVDVYIKIYLFFFSFIQFIITVIMIFFYLFIIIHSLSLHLLLESGIIWMHITYVYPYCGCLNASYYKQNHKIIYIRCLFFSFLYFIFFFRRI